MGLAWAKPKGKGHHTMSNIIDDIKNEFERLATVDYAGYEPPGGDGWRDFYETGVVPVFADAEKGAQKELAFLKARRNRRAAALAAMKQVAAYAEEWRKNIDDGEQENANLCGDAGHVSATAEHAMKKIIWFIGEDDVSIAAIEADVKFFADFKTYIDADALLDKMLWTLHKIDPSRRVKTFRQCLKLLKVVTATREELRRSNAKMNNLMEQYTKPIFETLDGAYKELAPLLAAQKKIVEKHGPAAFEDPLPLRKTA